MRLLKLVPDDTNIDFMKWRYIATGLSVLLMIISIVLVATRGLNFGVDFVGGQMIRVTFTETAEAPVSELRDTVGSLGYGSPSIQRFGAPNEVSIRMRLPQEAEGKTGAANAMTNAIVGAIQKDYPGARVDGVDSVSGKVSDELFQKGSIALLAAMVAIAIYIWVRFEWQFGVGGLAALAHDVTLTFGFFALTQLEFDLNIIAALLTIIGYSLNDTIVVYDRIRENLKKYRKMEIGELLNLSVNETLSRTVMTSLTMVIVLVAMLLLGPETIFGFTAAMTLGIVVGTYSSIYWGAPILVWLKVGPDSFVPVGDKPGAVPKDREGYTR
ncbi:MULTISPECIES: protein translocase subunit SecF [Novosphingopyxis]|uniref:protein translocase subunit SecF n=1 Tax=Novosphingopyxis TaxID=2709686 RepID=UPI0016511CB9|nr:MULTISPECIES: protein translocase subunit SecF [Novosphingopyxis]MBH9537750.1 protein translocase subunit SecF [Novosphingopyxis sp. YJ-S2-01]